MYREVEFRAKSKLTRKLIYGNLIVKKTKQNISTLENELYIYKYSIQYRNKSGKYTTKEVLEDTIQQYIGTGEYGRIYEGMKLYDEYAEEYCTIEYDKQECGFRLFYDNYSEKIEDLDGLIILDKEE